MAAPLLIFACHRGWRVVDRIRMKCIFASVNNHLPNLETFTLSMLDNNFFVFL